MTNCPNCNSQNENDSLFCGDCGQSIGPLQSNQNSVTLTDIEKSKFFTFAVPFISKIDGGQFFKKPFRWLYIIFAVLNILMPLILLYLFIDNNVFKYGGFAAVVIFVFASFAFWIGFQLWWDRKSKINKYVTSGDEFLAIPVFSHYIQTLGEWYGVILGIISIGLGVASLFSNEATYYATQSMRLPLLGANYGGWIIILGPIAAFFIVVFTRCIAEAIRALASIANNTKKKNVTT
jgi:hypothetical protein